MSTSTMVEQQLDRHLDSISRTRVVDDVTWELRMALGYTIREARNRLAKMTLSERSETAVSIVHTRAQMAGLDPHFIGDVGVVPFNQGARISTPGFLVRDGLMLLPEQGQLGIRNCFNSSNGTPLYGGISARRLARGMVDRSWDEGDGIDDVMDFVSDLILMPLDDLRNELLRG